MGVFIALLVIISWASHLAYMLLLQPVNLLDVWFWVHMLIQTWLFTGLFITVHDSMHGTISANRKLNNVIGFSATLLFAGMWYPMLIKKHKMHHVNPGTALDPDYYTGKQNFFI